MVRSGLYRWLMTARYTSCPELHRVGWVPESRRSRDLRRQQQFRRDYLDFQEHQSKFCHAEMAVMRFVRLHHRSLCSRGSDSLREHLSRVWSLREHDKQHYGRWMRKLAFHSSTFALSRVKRCLNRQFSQEAEIVPLWLDQVNACVGKMLPLQILPPSCPKIVMLTSYLTVCSSRIRNSLHLSKSWKLLDLSENIVHYLTHLLRKKK